MKDSFKRIMKTEIKGIPHEYQWAAFLLPMLLLGAVFLGQFSRFSFDGFSG